ncbi:MAG: YaiI/YqxD family protein [Pseudomonadota bacterium]
MNIWVDADACPGAIKDILFRAARRTGCNLTLVANHALPVPADTNIRMRQVSSGFDVADDEIVKLSEAGDLVITSDIPLAAEVIEKGAHVLSARGERLTADNIKPRLNMRDFMDTMRASGMQSGGPPPLSNQDKQKFANQLDSLLAKVQAKPKA